MPTMDHPPIACPSCRQPMEKRALGGRSDARTLRLDLCHPCHGIWFDRNESVLLAPEAVIDLFREIHAHEDGPRNALESRLGCPRCAARLALVHDVGRTGRFSYYRCPEEHGRFTPFFQFLREKHFVRSLTPAELARVRAELKVVRCSSCGAPVDLGRETVCGFCRSPIAVLDADAVEKALREWSDAAAKRAVPSKARLAEAMLDMKQIERRAHAQDRMAKRLDRTADAVELGWNGTDLLDGAISAIGDLLSGIDL